MIKVAVRAAVLAFGEQAGGGLQSAVSSMDLLYRHIAALLKPDPANEARLSQWAQTARAADLPALHGFTRGLDLDRQAVITAVILPFHNGRTEGPKGIQPTARAMRQYRHQRERGCSLMSLRLALLTAAVVISGMTAFPAAAAAAVPPAPTGVTAAESYGDLTVAWNAVPKEFRLRGDRVRVRHVGDGVLLEPIASDVDAWFAELDRFADVPLFDEGRNQPPTPAGEDIFG